MHQINYIKFNYIQDCRKVGAVITPKIPFDTFRQFAVAKRTLICEALMQPVLFSLFGTSSTRLSSYGTTSRKRLRSVFSGRVAVVRTQSALFLGTCSYSVKTRSSSSFNSKVLHWRDGERKEKARRGCQSLNSKQHIIQRFLFQSPRGFYSFTFHHT